MNRIRFADAPGLVKGRFTDNNVIETDAADGVLNCQAGPRPLQLDAKSDRPVAARG